MFKKKMLAGVVAVAFSGAALAAEPGSFDAYVGAGVNVLDDGRTDTLGLGTVAVSYQLTQNIGAQLNVNYSQEFKQDPTLKLQDSSIHLFHRNDQFLIGAYAQTSTAIDEEESFQDTGTTFQTYGVEAQYFLDNFTLGGKFNTSRVFGINGDGYSAEAKYFVQDNLRLDLSYASAKWSGGDSVNMTTLGAEYRLPNSPVSIFGRYSQFSSGDAKVYTVGINYNFGTSGTLIQRDRKGASLTTNNVPKLFGIPSPFQLQPL